MAQVRAVLSPCTFPGCSVGTREETPNGVASGCVCRFDNSYFTDMKAVSFQDDGGDLLTLPTDFALTEDPVFKKTFEEFKDQKKFFAAYAPSENFYVRLSVISQSSGTVTCCVEQVRQGPREAV